MAMFVTLQEAQADLDRLLVLVEAGEEIFIASGGRVVARLVATAGPSEGGADAESATAIPQFEATDGL